MKLNLVLLRHYTTYLNAYNLYSGQLDVPIIHPVQSQMNTHYDLVLSSTLIRCKQTVDILNKNHNFLSFLNSGHFECPKKTRHL